MIETQLVNYLAETLGIFVGMEPQTELTNYVIVDKTGSSRSNRIITTSVAIQSYGASLYDALLLSKQVEAAMQGFLQQPNVARVELETDYNFTDTTTKQYRWQAVYQITHY